MSADKATLAELHATIVASLTVRLGEPLTYDVIAERAANLAQSIIGNFYIDLLDEETHPMVNAIARRA